MSGSTFSPTSKATVAVIGGGLAGIAAATALSNRSPMSGSTLSQHGFSVTLLEARNQLGGRAGSHLDSQSNEVIDNCQHVSMGCCTNLAKLCKTLNIDDQFQSHRNLTFISPDGRMTPFTDDPLPAPFHLLRSFLRLPYLSFREKVAFGKCVRKLARASDSELSGQRCDDWLRAQGQSEALIRRVWEVVLVSALSESLDRIDAAYARKVFVDGFLANRTGWRIEIPLTSLGDLYSERAMNAMRSLGIDVRLQQRVDQLSASSGRIENIIIREGEEMVADEVILAVPHYHVGKLLPKTISETDEFQRFEEIETAPITSVHLWYDQQITDLEHAVFVDRLSQWLFRRPPSVSDSSDEQFRYQVVISASRNLKGMSPDQIVDDVVSELATLWPCASQAHLRHARVVTEKRAVFSATPGIDQFRPVQQTSIANLQLAGDWTQTGWPATMEGAVRSGYLAAQNLFRKYGIEEPVLADDLPWSSLSRWFFGKPQTNSSSQ